MSVMIFGRASLVGLLALFAPFVRPAAAQHDPRADAALLEAAVTGDAAKVKALLATGADARTCNKLGWPVSTLAACRGHTEVVRQLYEHDERTADQAAPGEWTPLQEAVLHNHPDTVRFLLTCHIHPLTANNEGVTAEEYARGHGYTDILAAFHAAAGEPPKPDSDPDEDIPLTAAATTGDTATLAKLLDRGGPIETRNAGGRTALICAVKHHHPEAVRLLLDRHADPNHLSRFGSSALDFAVKAGDEPIVKMLLEAGADPNGFRSHDDLGDEYSPLFLSFGAGRLGIVKLLLAHGARLDDLNNAGDAALIQAACHADVAVLAFLVEHGQSVNARNYYGYTALMYAASNGCDDNIRFLLDKGADLHAKTKDRTPNHRQDQPYGPLEAAKWNGEPFALEALLDAGATPADAEFKSSKELFAGIDTSDFECVQAALHHGASANDPGVDNRMPLHTAVRYGDPGIVRLLLKAGADVNKETPGIPGNTALDSASSQLDFVVTHPDRIKDPHAKENLTRIIEMLRQAQASR